MISLLSVFLVSQNNIILSVLLFVFLMFLVVDSVKRNVMCELQWQPDGDWLIRVNKEVAKAELQTGSVVTPVFSLLKFKLENNKKFIVILFKDSVDVEKFRQFRVRIKVEGLQTKKERDTLGG
ncbi:MAG: hypothetical protein DIZ80_07390 [endosymbiont of Galathealinum brachiosum]|uniref:Uncharacterized protein n=1 Tax=endosymbiont of Galathealinum brachiosum TaxID=2200906 RepID=A0A370DHD4_9GAMM|nr:MAG: hypothetical protein DIZ80_07390 [endosymbiont of Galathealinum brachiosum]